MKLPHNFQVTPLFLGFLAVALVAPYVWTYLVTSSVVVNIVLSTIVLTTVARMIVSYVLRLASAFLMDIQTRPTK